MGWPDIGLLSRTLFDYRYGLIPSAPLLALGLFAWTGRGVLPRREARLAVCLIVGLLLFCSANRYGYMQFNTGVRHVLPAVPFVFLLAAGPLARLPRIPAFAVSGTGLAWSWCLSMYRDVELGWGVLEAPRHVLTEGLQLPWLKTLTLLGYTHGRLPTALVLTLGVVVVVAIWRIPAPLFGAPSRAQTAAGATI
jgi:hypothetical protein